MSFLSWLFGNESPIRPRRAKVGLGLERLETRDTPAAFYANPLYAGVPSWNADTALRGVVITPDSLAANYATNAPDVLRSWHVNVLRVELVSDPVGQVTPSNPTAYQTQLTRYNTWLDGEIGKITKVESQLRRDGIGIIIDMHDPIGGPLWGSSGAQQIFTDATVGNQFVEEWKHIADVFRNSKVVVGFDLDNEPAPPTATPNATPAEAKPWNDLAARTERAIRAVGGENAHRTIIVEAIGGNPNNLKRLTPSAFVGPIVYSFHFYQPMHFTDYTRALADHLAHPNDPLYPAPKPTDQRLPKDWQQQVDNFLAAVVKFQKDNEKYKPRIYVGEFSASLLPDGFPVDRPDGTRVAVPNSSKERKQDVADYLKYVTDQFEQHHWDWTYHAFEEAPVWNLRESFGHDLHAALWKRSTLPQKWDSNARLFTH